MSRFSYLLQFTVLIALSLSTTLLSSCSSIPKVPVALTVLSGSNINSDNQLEALPVRIRVYQLTDVRAFKDASFLELWKKDRQTLGESFISKTELTISPSDKQKIKLTRSEKTKYIGIVALFRRSEGSQWRIYRVVDWQANSLISSIGIIIEGNSVRFQ